MEENPYKSSTAWDNQDQPIINRPKTGVIKKIFIALGIFMFLIILLFVWVGVKTTATRNKLEGKAEPLIRQVIAEQSPWDYEKLKPHLSQLWLDSVSEEQNNKMIKFFSKLKNFKSITEFKWIGCSTNSTPQYGTIDKCNYAAIAKYENGDAEVLVGVVIEDDAPKIAQLHINSDVFLE